MKFLNLYPWTSASPTAPDSMQMGQERGALDSGRGGGSMWGLCDVSLDPTPPTSRMEGSKRDCCKKNCVCRLLLTSRATTMKRGTALNS